MARDIVRAAAAIVFFDEAARACLSVVIRFALCWASAFWSHGVSQSCQMRTTKLKAVLSRFSFLRRHMHEVFERVFSPPTHTHTQPQPTTKTNNHHKEQHSYKATTTLIPYLASNDRSISKTGCCSNCTAGGRGSADDAVPLRSSPLPPHRTKAAPGPS